MKLTLIIISIIFLFLFISFIIFNTIHKVKIHEANTETIRSLEYFLKEKWNLIPKLIKTTQHINENNNAIEKLIILKNRLYNKLTLEEKLNLNKQLSQEIESILINSSKILENDEKFLEINDTLSKIEKNIKKLEPIYLKQMSKLNK